MGPKYHQLLQNSINTKEQYRPDFFRLANEESKKSFNDLLESGSVFCINDELYDQLRELNKSRNPTRKLTTEDYSHLIAQHLNGQDIKEYGVWVFYPWSGRMVHMLDEAEFIELRTAANRNKITIAEREVLATKKVGVIGLSVGQSVSVTLALERGCGELRLADFDTLELNNLNRIRTGVHNLGLLKAYAVAREIAEIDPFFKTVCYTEGLTDENIDDFFMKGGKLDAVIDECDSVNVKIQCRIKAKELHVPVIMEASDRGTLDVERFDLDPQRPIIHGWLEGLTIDLNVLKNLKTTEEKLPYMLPISGLETLSNRMKASMVEIENTLTTWPQLASAVALGGAVAADTCRRIFLDQYTDSGRYFIDLEKIIPDTRVREEFVLPYAADPLTEEEMSSLANDALRNLPANVTEIGTNEITEIVGAAIQAPSAGNNQPWKWLYKQGTLFLFHDKVRSISFGDFENIASDIALGAAIENLELQSSKMNVGTSVHYFPIPGNTKLIAAIQFTATVNSSSLYNTAELGNYIFLRETNRNFGPRVRIDEDKINLLREAVASVPGAGLFILDKEDELDEIADIFGSAERLRLLHPEGHIEFYQKELRWTPEQSQASKDGIDLATIELLESEMVGLRLVKDMEVAKLLSTWRAGKGLERIPRKAVKSASVVGLVTMPDFSPMSFLTGGRAVQRMWLQAAKCDVSLQPMVAALLHFARLVHGDGVGMPALMKEEFTELYPRFVKLFPGAIGKEPVFLFRLSIANKPSVKSYRIPVDKMLTFA